MLKVLETMGTKCAKQARREWLLEKARKQGMLNMIALGRAIGYTEQPLYIWTGGKMVPEKAAVGLCEVLKVKWSELEEYFCLPVPQLAQQHIDTDITEIMSLIISVTNKPFALRDLIGVLELPFDFNKTMSSDERSTITKILKERFCKEKPS